jgi:hypothetical protein
MIDNSEEPPKKTEESTNEDSWNQSLKTVSCNMKSLWKFDEIDFRNLKFLISYEVICWCLGISNGSIYSALLVYDGPFFTYAAKTLYNIPDDWLFFRTNNMKPRYMACHFPGYPLIIKLCSMLCLGSYTFGSLLAISLTSFLSTFVFRRLLIVYDLVYDPNYTSLLSVFVPIRFMMYRTVGANEPLYMTCVFLSMIFFKTNQILLLLLSMIVTTITKIEGLSIVGTIGLCYLLKLDLLKAIFSGFGAIGTVAVLFMHKIYFGSPFVYFEHNQGARQKLLEIPFLNYVEYPRYDVTLMFLYQKLVLQVPMLAGLCVLWKKSLPLGIFIFVYFIFTGAISHLDIFRYGMPAYMPALLIGFDVIWNNPMVKGNITTILIIYLIVAILYITGQINTNIIEKDIYQRIVNRTEPF